ncbi:hypothetical protein [Nocardia cyriacigeorgica]|uniref:hypothetical protein n=1 Tax=Nocardia cyriacigeorgica TaxID=135487 RepID=UPI00189368BF|nr:hypothetical protein [Nocardia cyriacigeorgica]MBF6416996.1 hypothetical protein [Nocardia cyriacigeorgica]
MSGTAEPVREPTNDPEWARETTRRLDSLENPTAQRIGPWVLSAADDGSLIGSYVEGGSVVLARPPAGGENDPDSIQDDVLPEVTVTRMAGQNIPAAGAQVIFDGVRIEQGGDWTGGRTTFDAVTVPETGYYTVSGTVHFNTGSALMAAGIVVDDVFMAGGRASDAGNPWPSAAVLGRMLLNAGQSVSLFAYAGSARTIGGSAFFTPAVPTELSLVMSQRSR